MVFKPFFLAFPLGDGEITSEIALATSATLIARFFSGGSLKDESSAAVLSFNSN